MKRLHRIHNIAVQQLRVNDLKKRAIKALFIDKDAFHANSLAHQAKREEEELKRLQGGLLRQALRAIGLNV